MSTVSVSPAAVLVLPDRLGSGAAADLKAALAARKGRSVVLDASSAGALGALCLQVLLAASKAWRGQGLGFEVRNATPAFREALQTFGVTADGIGLEEAGRVA